MARCRLLAVARGDEPADLLFKGGRLVNVLTGEIYAADVAVADGLVAGVGEGLGAREVVELDGRFICPGFIDAHVHIESAMVPPREFAAAVVPHGVTTVIADPHEIANVLGAEGIRFMLRDSRETPLKVRVNLPSCVPATGLATAGAALDAAELVRLLDEPEVLGLGEVMNYPGVVAGEQGVLDKLQAFEGRPIDGHCPGLDGLQLAAYVAAGIHSDHESCSLDEARRKARLGLTIFIREGSVARNLESLLPLVSPANERRFCFCTDDRHPPDLIAEGSIDHLIRVAIARGLDPIAAIRLGTLNAAEHFQLRDRGAVAPGRAADLLVFSQLEQPRPERVYIDGRLVAREGRMLDRPGGQTSRPENTVHIDWSAVSLEVPLAGKRIRAIDVVPDQLVTEALVVDCPVDGGRAVADPRRDLLKIAVIERHRASGNVGVGFVRGLGLTRGAIASTVAHDHHNLVVAGADDRSMLTAARAVAAEGGGLAAAEGETVLEILPLPIAGLLSERPFEEVASRLERVIDAARGLGSQVHDPFMAMSFLALEVIPALKLTDQGLVDVDRQRTVPLFAS